MTLEEKLQNLPPEPGVYLMKDHAGRIIYVGKALSLKNRVRSYFQKGAIGEKTGVMTMRKMGQATSLQDYYSFSLSSFPIPFQGGS